MHLYISIFMCVCPCTYSYDFFIYICVMMSQGIVAIRYTLKPQFTQPISLTWYTHFCVYV